MARPTHHDMTHHAGPEAPTQGGGQAMGENVPPLPAEEGRLPRPLSQAFERGEHVQHDQGHHVRSKTPVAMVNEVFCKLICHNICVLIQEAHELGINTSARPQMQ